MTDQCDQRPDLDEEDDSSMRLVVTITKESGQKYRAQCLDTILEDAVKDLC